MSTQKKLWFKQATLRLVLKSQEVLSFKTQNYIENRMFKELWFTPSCFVHHFVFV
jgi:hypothetical protein